MVTDVVGDEVRGGTLVTWAPTTDSRRASRGFDQSELLARHVAAFTSMRCRSMLRRTNVGSQTGSGRGERLERPHFVARAAPRGSCIVVIDDVLTTGATLRAAAQALRLAGAHRVLGVAVSRVS